MRNVVGSGESPRVRSLGAAKSALDRREMAGPAGLEPVTSGVTGRRSNQLNYRSLPFDGPRW